MNDQSEKKAAPSQMKKGTWSVRTGILLSTIFLAVLFYWFLGFATHDIRSIKGPDYDLFLEEKIGKELKDKQESLGAEISRLNSEIRALKEEQALKSSGSKNMEATLEQLNKQIASTKDDAERERLNRRLDDFLKIQQEYQDLLGKISQSTLDRQALEREMNEVQKEIGSRDEAASLEWRKQMDAHRTKLALLELGLMVPLLLLAGYALLRVQKKQGSLLFPVLLAFVCATLVRLFFTLHEYLPRIWFKYIAIVAVIVVIIRFLVYLVGLATRPRPDRLLLQYRQAYEKYLCPICEYPIRVGPLKYLFWTRKSAVKTLAGTQKRQAASLSQPYTCPACGQILFETCPDCGNIRHTLMEHCEHCGARKEVKTLF